MERSELNKEACSRITERELLRYQPMCMDLAWSHIQRAALCMWPEGEVTKKLPPTKHSINPTIMYRIVIIRYIWDDD